MKILKSMAYTAVAAVAAYNVYLASDIQQVKSDLTFDTIELTASGAEPGGDNSNNNDYYNNGPAGGYPGRDPYCENALYGFDKRERTTTFPDGTINSQVAYYDKNGNVVYYDDLTTGTKITGPQIVNNTELGRNEAKSNSSSLGSQLGANQQYQIGVGNKIVNLKSSPNLSSNISSSISKGNTTTIMITGNVTFYRCLKKPNEPICCDGYSVTCVY